MLYNRMIGELLILLPTYARWRFHERRDWTCHQRHRIEQPRSGGTGHGPVAVGVARPNMQRRKEPATCDASHARFPGQGHTLFSDGDRRLRTLRSGRAGRGVPRFASAIVCVVRRRARPPTPPRRRPCPVPVCPPVAAERSRARARGRRMAIRAINAAPVRASHLALVPPQATTLPAVLLFQFLPFFPCLFFFGSRPGEPPAPRVAPAMSSRYAGPTPPHRRHGCTGRRGPDEMRSGNRHFGVVVWFATLWQQ